MTRRGRDGSELPDDTDDQLPLDAPAGIPQPSDEPADEPRMNRAEALAYMRRVLHRDDQRGGAT